ncbi:MULTISPECIES: hypothetical protein [Metallosphaera]|uniref:hypothetical protein n=1 Tax=Metallosphaera TaxID=41980 RepID=UPI001F06F5DF|nr:hypothetical protein [Metallosphaera sedula]MCP6728891.1 hypothetical protein [Metallosphaera sedula]
MPVDKSTLLKRALEVVNTGNEQGLILRLIGGAAVAAIAPEGAKLFPRTYKDADYFGLSSQRKAIIELLQKLGMEPDKRFNALHGYNRLLFFDPVLNTNVDVFLDEFVMCHKLILKDRLKLYSPSIPPSDLLLTKMQIINLTENDRKDIAALLYDFKISDRDYDKELDSRYIANLLSDDWGFYKTFTINFDRMREFLSSVPTEGKVILEKLETLMKLIESHPKSMKWKLRAKVGEKVKWYEEPEEVKASGGT